MSDLTVIKEVSMFKFHLIGILGYSINKLCSPCVSHMKQSKITRYFNPRNTQNVVRKIKHVPAAKPLIQSKITKYFTPNINQKILRIVKPATLEKQLVQSKLDGFFTVARKKPNDADQNTNKEGNNILCLVPSSVDQVGYFNLGEITLHGRRQPTLLRRMNVELTDGFISTFLEDTCDPKDYKCDGNPILQCLVQILNFSVQLLILFYTTKRQIKKISV